MNGHRGEAEKQKMAMKAFGNARFCPRTGYPLSIVLVVGLECKAEEDGEDEQVFLGASASQRFF